MPHPALSATIARYGDAARIGRHRHEELILVLTLRGRVREGGAQGEVVAGPGMVGRKPPGMWHTDEFGADGSVALRIAIPAETVARLPDPDAWLGWSWRPVDGALPAFVRLVEAVGRGGADDALVWDALAATRPAADRAGAPPAWLRTIRDALDDAPAIAAPLDTLAAEAGVHPVHLARTFRAWFGTSIVAYRRRRMAIIALGAIADGVPLSAAAFEAGFCDQPALTHALQREGGASPGHCRALLRALETGARR